MARISRKAAVMLCIGSALYAVAGCSPSVKIEAPDKPIVINLNVKIEQEVRIRIEKDLDSLFESKDKIF
ncbi:MAG: YnbE family lipoprotein [Proteobacteria bacterium]|nr:YnbE family lipoprotein [Pseudomonadota bacterium]MDA1308676.1 YnbE family lipoprotein [Pseudomonadota bacterium]